MDDPTKRNPEMSTTTPAPPDLACVRDGRRVLVQRREVERFIAERRKARR